MPEMPCSVMQRFRFALYLFYLLHIGLCFEAFDVVGLLNKYCISENEGGHGEASKSSNKDSDGTDTRSAKLVRELAIYR